MSYSEYWAYRGNPWDYDGGPPKNLKWPRLFSETPNYRQLSNTALSNEKFRWHFGPMYYRGRLRAGRVKVLVIGQEGAQDESLAHRSFVGGTGGRMQYLLNFIGIDYSYLFMNTFVYPIFGQYTNNIKWLAQDPRSPIVKHRHEVFDYVLQKNDVHLIVAVGNAAKESVKTWVESKGGNCPDGITDLSSCTANVLDPKTKIVGVLHPGGASQAGARAAIKASFQSAVNKIRDWMNADASWLPTDPGMARNSNPQYPYSKSKIPFHDLPFGITWRLGRGSTSSNRKDSQRSIQLFSAGGKYRNNGDSIHYTNLAHGSANGYSEEPGDVPYEPPVHHYKDYDKGPGHSFARLFMGGSGGLTWPDFDALGVKAHPSLGYGPIYRGRPDQARFLILADQESQDDLFACRALTGNGGQHIQAYLKAMGINRSYCIVRSLPVDTMDLSIAKRKNIVQDSRVVDIYQEIVNRILSRNKTKAIITLGSVSKTLEGVLNMGPNPVIHLKSWRQSGAKSNWQNAISSIQSITYAKDEVPTFTYNGERLQIPGYDLPYGTLKWQASSGDRARRAKNSNGDWSPDYYKLIMPDWAFDQVPRPLSASEQQALTHHP